MTKFPIQHFIVFMIFCIHHVYRNRMSDYIKLHNLPKTITDPITEVISTYVYEIPYDFGMPKKGNREL